MACEFCGEKNKSRLGMRTSVVNGKVETVEICSSCLWERLMHDENGKILPKRQTNTERVATGYWQL